MALYLAALISTAILLPLLVIALARLLRPDVNIFFIWLNSYTFWVYLPVYPIALFAAAFRRWVLLAPAVLVVALHLWWVLPDYSGATAIPAEAQDAPALRVVSANGLFGNTELDAHASELASLQPDLLFLQEFDSSMAAAIDRAGIEDRLPYIREAYAAGWATGIAVYSRYPLDDIEVDYVTRRPIIRADVTVDGATLRVFNIHPVSPGGRWVADVWNDGWRDLVAIFDAETGPFLVAGDFNMTQHHRWYGRLKDIGLKNCHEERGRGSATTWPNGTIRFLPPIRIDQVFVSDGVVCLDIAEGDGPGSDHRPVIADIAILPTDPQEVAGQ